MGEMIILGSAFAVANARQENTHLLARSEKRNILIDCGNNPVGKLEMAGLDINSITDLVLTHAHADHMGALPLLVMDMWLKHREAPLDIFGLEYTLVRAKMLLDVFGWQNWQNMFPVEFHQVEAQDPIVLLTDQGIQVKAIQVEHSVPTLAVRIDFNQPARSVVYSCDTRPCDRFDHLAKGAEIMIHEAAGKAEIHTSPEQAGEDAARAGAGKLILIHYDSGRNPADLINEAELHYSGEVALAEDMMSVF